MDYDTWKTAGNSNICVCGRKWDDADGESCHWVCKVCGCLLDESYDYKTDDGEICNECLEEELLEQRINKIEEAQNG